MPHLSFQRTSAERKPSFRRRFRRTQRGFTLLELIVVVAIAAVVLLVSVPKLLDLVTRIKLQGFVSDVTNMVRQARFESITTGYETVVVFDTGTNEVRAYVDVPEFDANGNRTDTIRAFDPELANELPERDHYLRVLEIPEQLAYTSPGGAAVNVGLTTIVDPTFGNLDGAVFQADGSIVDTGATTFGDDLGNYFRLYFQPAATAEIEPHKWPCGGGDATDQSKWVGRGRRSGDTVSWPWYTPSNQCGD